jgi:hypothetical protein
MVRAGLTPAPHDYHRNGGGGEAPLRPGQRHLFGRRGHEGPSGRRDAAMAQVPCRDDLACGGLLWAT